MCRIPLIRAGAISACSLLGVSYRSRSFPWMVGVWSPKHVMSMYLLMSFLRWVICSMTSSWMESISYDPSWLSELSEKEPGSEMSSCSLLLWVLFFLWCLGILMGFVGCDVVDEVGGDDEDDDDGDDDELIWRLMRWDWSFSLNVYPFIGKSFGLSVSFRVLAVPSLLVVELCAIFASDFTVSSCHVFFFSLLFLCMIAWCFCALIAMIFYFLIRFCSGEKVCARHSDVICVPVLHDGSKMHVHWGCAWAGLWAV